MSTMDVASHSQPVCTAVQIALVDLLAEFNVLPAAVVGHSSGESHCLLQSVYRY